MEGSKKMKMMVVVVCLTALSVFAVARYGRRWKEEGRRKKKKKDGNSCCCSSDLENKPQNNFKRVLADNSYAPFKHLKREGSKDENSTNLHPYEDEIMLLLEHPPTSLDVIVSNEQLCVDTPCVWVSTQSELEVLADTLSKERVFAVDTEQHSLRSFLGFTALVQISTKKEDYLIDTISLHDVMSVLRPVFADPSICKVFHGSDNDVLWLQRDFHIYVVNSFDTAKACEVLAKPQKSLAYLLETYCGESTNKMLQLEDWRLRPLSAEMVHYARSDAHYLLYIANCLFEELIMKGTENSVCADDKLSFVLEASRRSNMVCLQLYAKDNDASPGDSAAASIFSRRLNGQGDSSWKSNETAELVRKLCTWRDLMARIHDESLRYVLSDQAIAAIASHVPSILTELYEIVLQADLSIDCSSMCSTLSSPSPIVSSHLTELFDLLQENTDCQDDFFERIIQAHLGPNGTCQLSIYNYALLSKSNLKLTSRLFSKQNGGKPTKQVGRKPSRELFVQKFSCKSPVYHNCRIYANDSRLLCYCDRRKLEWLVSACTLWISVTVVLSHLWDSYLLFNWYRYLCRDLAKLVEEDPPSIMLLFEPKGRPEDEDNDFYIQSKKNICVGCGEGNHYLRYRIIPSCYRIHFPEHLKSHRSHDIVLLCVDCHEIAHSASEKYKKQVAAEFDIPLFVQKVVDPAESQESDKSGLAGNPGEAGVSPLQLRTAAMALLRHGSRLPSKRREELLSIVRMYFGGREVSDEDLETALLVGMSPHERRRLEKKKALSFKRSEEGVCSKKSDEESGKHISTYISETLDGDCRMTGSSNKSYYRISEDQNISKGMDFDETDTSPYCDVEVDSFTVVENLNKNGMSKHECVRLLDADFEKDESRKLPNGTSKSSPSKCNGTSSSKYGPKFSLLGHGPHGKLVVQHLLQEYGEDGIRQFCQRWRQVFVEAIKPRFLPAGWDIMHSGRREFGEYSVYNPVKRASNALEG